MTDAGPHASNTYGKKAVNLEGLYRDRQARVAPDGEFSNVDRKWRSQYLKDQKLSPRDGNVLMLEKNKDYQKARYNIYRRIWRTPMNLFEDMLCKFGMNLPLARNVRIATSTFGHALVFGWFVTYYMLYRSDDWTSTTGWKVRTTKPAFFPGDEERGDLSKYDRSREELGTVERMFTRSGFKQ